MGLFSDIYNTVAKFFRPQEEQGDPSKSVATNRLKLVLMQDRTNLTPKILEQMRGELIDLLSRYVELDKELLELNFEHEGDQVALMLSIPVIRAKDEAEIEASLKEKSENSEGNENENFNEDLEQTEIVAEEAETDDEDYSEESNQNMEDASENNDSETSSNVSKPNKKSSVKKTEEAVAEEITN